MQRGNAEAAVDAAQQPGNAGDGRNFRGFVGRGAGHGRLFWRSLLGAGGGREQKQRENAGGTVALS